MNDSPPQDWRPTADEEFVQLLQMLVSASAENGVEVTGGHPVWSETELVGWDVEITRVDKR